MKQTVFAWLRSLSLGKSASKDIFPEERSKEVSPFQKRLSSLVRLWTPKSTLILPVEGLKEDIPDDFAALLHIATKEKRIILVNGLAMPSIVT